ncbi:hypothetical protein FNV43_RR26317 [Rhamnella rubrinervis]|uniref:Uncharacterized protein n=1 Tax=Rhamnella rubrinervis TaxID=2594499 RepID=A0A8K0DJH2_9ROSA|nr:hypothetical protein FNV43_RR26317 [Rhamnella rubrinervis]
MGFWVGAYAAGANYVAKYWQKLISGKSLSESNQWKSEIGGDLGLEAASTSGKTGEEPQAPIEQGKEGIDEFYSEQVSDFILTGNGSLLQRLKGSRNLRSKCNGFSVKPLKSLESCLTSQLLYREHARMEQYVYSSFSSPCTVAMRPLFVTDGGRIISRASIGFSEKSWLENGEELQKQGGLEGNKARLRSFGYPRRRKQNVRKGQYRRRCGFTTRATTGPFHSQGLSNGMVLFFLGVTVGIVSNIIATKSNLDKLNELLKQSQNLVQDLHEELEMKDSLTVKELSSEDLECQGTNEHSNGISTAFSPERKLDKFVDCGGKEPDESKAKYSEARSQIEAELEAELELLELNIKKSSLQRASHYDMLDPDFREGIIQENLKPDKVNWELGRLPDSDHDSSRTPVNHTCEASNAVSPWELSFRLHEVIASRLKARIMDLEAELKNSQNKVRSMELENMVPERGSCSQLGSSSTEGNDRSPAGVQEGNDFNHPLVTNLSGASDSYNEAYEEISKMSKTEKECIYKEKPPFEKKPSEGQNGGDSFLTWHYDVSEERWSRDSYRDEEMPPAEGFSRSSGSSMISDSEAINDEENEKHLIKKIVEKSRYVTLQF